MLKLSTTNFQKGKEFSGTNTGLEAFGNRYLYDGKIWWIFSEVLEAPLTNFHELNVAFCPGRGLSLASAISSIWLKQWYSTLMIFVSYKMRNPKESFWTKRNPESVIECYDISVEPMNRVESIKRIWYFACWLCYVKRL